MITKEQFESYVDIQKMGVTNMWNVRVVSDLTGLTREEIREIMKNYGNLKDKYEKETNHAG